MNPRIWAFLGMVGAGLIAAITQDAWRWSADRLIDHVDRWRKAGATHLAVNTMGAGLGAVDGHLDALTKSAEALNLM